jgi:hypothetical protein
MTNVDYNKENVALLQTVDKNQKNVNHFNSNNDTFIAVPSNNNNNNNNQVDWVDTVVNCALIMNKIFTRNTCRLCHIYSDKQVEFEARLQENATIAAATAAEWYKNNNIYYDSNSNYNYDNASDSIFHQQQEHVQQNDTFPMSSQSHSSSIAAIDPHVVELYRQQLFDEESVVDSIELRMVQDPITGDAKVDDDDDNNTSNNNQNEEQDTLTDVQLV